MPPRVAGPTSLLKASPPNGDNALPPGFGITVRSVPSSVEVSRRLTRAWARCSRMPEQIVDALLIVVSELCTNAVQHGRCKAFTVRAWMSAAGELHFEVHDGTPSPVPQPQRPTAEAENGRGLFLVDLLITELGGTWGFTEDGTCVWCRLPLPQGDQ
ncbi:ATP-binding protein [Streptomyces sp. NPDC003697]